MSTLNPIQQAYPSTITGLDLKINDINAELATIDWLTLRFNRAWNIPESRDDGLYRQPRIYSGSKDYWNVMPNDDQQAFSFMIGKGAATPVGDELTPLTTSIRWTKRVDLIVFLDLSKIDSSKEYIYTEELNEDVIKALNKVRGVITGPIIMEDIRDVYEGFDLSEIERDSLYYPFAGIRYELEVSYYLGSSICN